MPSTAIVTSLPHSTLPTDNGIKGATDSIGRDSRILSNESKENKTEKGRDTCQDYMEVPWKIECSLCRKRNENLDFKCDWMIVDFVNLL